MYPYYYTATSLVDSILQVVQAAELSSLTMSIVVKDGSAIGQLGVGLEGFFDQLRETVSIIRKNSEAVNEASTTLTQISRQLD